MSGANSSPVPSMPGNSTRVQLIWPVSRRRPSRLNDDRGLVGHDAPDFLDLAVGDGDAAIGPVHERVDAAEPAEAVAQAMDHDEPARIDTALLRVRLVDGRGIGNMQRKVKRAVGIAIVEHV